MTKRPSSITTLPEDILSSLQDLLRDPRVTQLEATAKINAILAAEGHPERLSKSAVNRYSVKMDAVGKKLRESREVSKMWIAKLGSEPAGQVGHLLNEMVRTLAFEATMQMAEDDDTPVEPKMLKDLSVAIRNLERASSENVKRTAEIKKQAMQAAAETAVTAAKKGGLSEESVNAIRRDILGINQ